MLGITTAGAMKLAARNERSAGVEPFHYATLVYPFVFTSSSAASNTWYWQFRINSLYDPDFTGGGSQPTTFDQWMALYDRYRVIATTAEISVGNVASASGGLPSCVMAMAPGQDAAPTLTFQGVAGMRDARQSNFNKNYGNTAFLKATYMMKDVFGVDEEAIMSELNFTGSASASAASVAYLTVAGWVLGATDAVVITGKLSFAVRFENPHSNNVSLARLAANPDAPVARAVTGASSSLEGRQASLSTYTAESCVHEERLVYDPALGAGRRICGKCLMKL